MTVNVVMPPYHGGTNVNFDKRKETGPLPILLVPLHRK
jgi:hypothetical protein